MAAFDTPFSDFFMADGNADGESQATTAAFAPNQETTSHIRQRSAVLIQQKSPLLVATPPQVTRALAYSHAFVLPLNHLVGLLSWTTGDPWESFLMVAAFWFVVLYADKVLRWAGPLVLVAGIIVAMYWRRYSPLSSAASGDAKRKRKGSDDEQRKSLDEIVDTLGTFTNRCEVLWDPCLRFTEYLSTQSTATSATTRPALTTLFIRILAFTPIWIVLALPQIGIITTPRVFLAVGTIGLSWHSRPSRVTRTILWRSRFLRNTLSLLTGLNFPTSGPASGASAAPGSQQAAVTATKSKSSKGPKSAVRFTFSIYENQRRWVGLGWTSSMLTYERQPWTDEHLNPVPGPDEYALPDTETESTAWRWVPGSEWRVEGAARDREKSAKRIGGGGGGDHSGWTYFDNKWTDGRKEDGWSRWTRKRKWVRDAELLDATAINSNAVAVDAESLAPSERDAADNASIESATTPSGARRRAWLTGRRQKDKGKSSSISSAADGAGAEDAASGESRRSQEVEDDVHTPLERLKQHDWDRSINEGLAEGLG